MMSLFSSFDMKHMLIPTFFYIMVSLLLFLNFYFLSSKSVLESKVKSIFQNLFLGVINPLSKNFILVSLSLFLYLISSNYASILSFNFALNSQISVILFSSLSIWLSFVIFMAVKNLKYFIMHCIPEGTPYVLVSFLFLIELVSQTIRPLTLTIRLVANILAGHLLMILLSNLSLYSFFMCVPYLVLNAVEMFVAIVQAYIMITMISLYYKEVC